MGKSQTGIGSARSSKSPQLLPLGSPYYFCFDGFFAVVKEFAARYPHSPKVFFPNLELLSRITRIPRL